MVEVSLIIPAYNEGLRIERTIISNIKNFQEHFKNFEILVILNGCKDNTLEVVQELQKRYPKYLKYKNYKEAIGKGGAIVKGLKYCKGNIIGFVDADDAFESKNLIKLIKSLKNCDCIIASKWKNHSFMEVNEPFMRKVFSRGWNILVRIFLGLNFKDTQAGAKFFTKQVKDNIGSNFICNHFAFDAELLFKIKNHNFKIKEVYVPSKHVEGSTFKLQYSFQMFNDLMKLWRSRF